MIVFFEANDLQNLISLCIKKINFNFANKKIHQNCLVYLNFVANATMNRIHLFELVMLFFYNILYTKGVVNKNGRKREKK